jgi:hypothetical protein
VTHRNQWVTFAVSTRVGVRIRYDHRAPMCPYEDARAGAAQPASEPGFVTGPIDVVTDPGAGA